MKEQGYNEQSLLAAVLCFENTYKYPDKLYKHAIWILQNSATPITERTAIAITKSFATFRKLTPKDFEPLCSYISIHKELGKYLACMLCNRLACFFKLINRLKNLSAPLKRVEDLIQFALQYNINPQGYVYFYVVLTSRFCDRMGGVRKEDRNATVKLLYSSNLIHCKEVAFYLAAHWKDYEW